MNNKFSKLFTAVILSILVVLNSTNLAQESTSDFSILVLSDIHISSDETKDIRLTNLIEAINSEKFNNVELLIATGDNVSSFQKDRNGDKTLQNQRGKKFAKLIKQVDLPYLIVLGNHDYKIDSDRDSDDPFSKAEIDTMEFLWKEIADLKPYYSFEHNGWNIIILNSMRGRYLDRFFDDEQMDWFSEELKKEKPVLVFFHHPIETDNFKNINRPTDVASPEIEPQFYEILKENKEKVKGIFAGHIHRWFEDAIFDSIPVYVTDSFADNELSPYRLININSTSNKIETTEHEYLDK